MNKRNGFEGSKKYGCIKNKEKEKKKKRGITSLLIKSFIVTKILTTEWLIR